MVISAVIASDSSGGEAALVFVLPVLFSRSDDAASTLLLGRMNFAAMSLAIYAGYRLVGGVAGLPEGRADRVLLVLSTLLALVSASTPLVDAAESVHGGVAQTSYGLLFPLYVLHIVVLLGAALRTAFSRSHVPPPHRGSQSSQSQGRDALLLLGWGILGTGVVSLVSNVVLPYAFGDFRWIDIGPLSTLLFLLAVAYAVVRHRLFDIRVFLRRTLVLGIALSVVLACYSALVLLGTDRLASSESGGVTRFGVLVLAFSFDPIRRFLEGRIDKLLFPEKHPARRGNRSAVR